MKPKKQNDMGNKIYFYSLILYSVYSLLSVSMFTEILPAMLITSLIVFSICGFFIKILFFSNYSILETMFGFLILVLVLYIWKFDGYRDPLLIFILIFSSKEVDFIKIVKYYFITSSIVLLIITISSQYNIIVDLVFSRGSIARHALGTVYPTVYSARLFFLILAYIFLRKFKINIVELLVIMGLNYWMYIKTNARLDYYIIIVIVLFFFVLTYINSIIKRMSWICVLLPVISLVTIVFLSKKYGSGANFYYSLNELFSNRLQIGNLAFQLYDIKLLGQNLYLQGNGGRQGINNIVNQYFFLDSGYMVSLFQYGSLFTVMSIGLLITKLSTLFKMKSYFILYIFGIISIYSIISGSLFHLANVFILLIFASYNEKDYLISKTNDL